MTRVLWTAAATVLSAFVLATWIGTGIWFGMAAPLAVVSASWILVERVYRANPERLTSMMMGAFAGKLVFFGAYVGMVIGVLGVQPVPFAASFAGYFIVLHMVEAFWLKRLFVS
jgi:hypothetical protein